MHVLNLHSEFNEWLLNEYCSVGLHYTAGIASCQLNKLSEISDDRLNRFCRSH